MSALTGARDSIEPLDIAVEPDWELVLAVYVPDPMDLRITLKLNGEIKQDESTSDMLFDIPRLLEYLTSRVKLLPGGVLEGHIAGLGTQRNAIRDYRG